MGGPRRHRMAEVHRDANEPELVTIIKRMGGKIWMAPPLDFWLLFRGAWCPTEIKRPEVEGLVFEYKPSQKRFFRFCEENNAPYLILHTMEDVIHVLNVVTHETFRICRGTKWPTKRT
jgi:hypothetical protein